MSDVPAQAAEPPGPQIKITHALLVGILLFAAFTRIWRLGEPERCYFDEVYFPPTGTEILKGDQAAWDFFGHENTHPPLSKVMMAGGMFVFGHKDYNGATNNCWPDENDVDMARSTDPDWLYDPFGFRFPGALMGIVSVVFMYLLARRLFQSEVAGLASAFLLSLDGLVLTQSRIATPDTYVLGFALGALYFLVSSTRFLSWRMLAAGSFLGAAAASKWIGAFFVIPLALYFAWQAFNSWREAGPDDRLREAERVLLVGASGIVLGAILFAATYTVIIGELSWTVVLAGGIPALLGAFVILGGLVAIVTEPELRAIPRAKSYVQVGSSFALFFFAVPFSVYMASYIPMFIEGQGLNHWWDLNRSAYEFHSSLTSPHSYQSDFWEWPINRRPVFFFVTDYAKIYNLGNPLIFWMALPALAFTAWRGLKFVRFRIEPDTGFRLWGRISAAQWPLLFTVIGYLVMWLALSSQGRALFSYHYQPALAFAILALGYLVHWLWYHEHPWARHVAIAFLLACFATFVYFYPHWAAVNVDRWLDDTYYWFDSWR